ncbi:hypothetical protein DQ04_14521000, partial [Trypanosoma grayi]|uniref:hypothetical protein n=1 Tax=Trypanosoma grayi TaxID=71804 RepID=UPI0004F424C7
GRPGGCGERRPFDVVGVEGRALERWWESSYLFDDGHVCPATAAAAMEDASSVCLALACLPAVEARRRQEGREPRGDWPPGVPAVLERPACACGCAHRAV